METDSIEHLYEGKEDQVCNVWYEWSFKIAKEHKQA